MFKRAFTLIEMLLVIALIGLLSTVLIVSFSGSSESARAAKCMSNLRAIAQASIGYAMGSQYGYFPYAGCWVEPQLVYSNGKYVNEFHAHRGWISWLDRSYQYNWDGNGKYPRSFIKCDVGSSFMTDTDDIKFAIEEGALWDSLGHDRAVLVCPTHEIEAKKHNVRPNWSYCMSAYFGYDPSAGAKAQGAGVKSFSGSRMDRRILFAELPFARKGSFDSANQVEESVAYSQSKNNTYTDAVLQYRGSVNGTEYHQNWRGTPEAIAFNHKSGKQWCAHVVFADGHTEKIVKPKLSSGLDSVTLTTALCEGFDVSFDGKSYTLLNTQSDTVQ